MPAQRQASALQITVGSDGVRAALMTAVALPAGGALMAALMMLAALMSQSGLGIPAAHQLSWLLLGTLLLLPGAVRMSRRCSRTRSTSLRWGGRQCWLDETPVRPRPVIDLGSSLLLLLGVALRSLPQRYRLSHYRLSHCRLSHYLPLARARGAAHRPQLRATPNSACIVASRKP